MSAKKKTKRADKPVKDETPQKTEASKQDAPQSAQKPEPTPAEAEPPRLYDGPFIVGIGASAGGLEAMTELLRSLPADTGAALVMVQHLSPTHTSALPELLAHATEMPVIEMEDGTPLEPDHVYVSPPDVQVGFHGSSIRLVKRTGSTGNFKPIDFCFQAIADLAQARSIGVVLSGTATDGAKGLAVIKTAGGIALAQTPETARFRGMPEAAIETGAVDIALPPPRLAQEIARLVASPAVRRNAAGGLEPTMDITDQHVRHIRNILHKVSGVDFSLYKPATLRRRIHRRIVLHKLTTADEYIDFLRKDDDEPQMLYQDILIHVTRFFREPEAFELLKDKVFPAVIQEQSGEQPIRIWTPGCSTGEECYSVVIALLEALGEDAGVTPIQVFATDISDAAIEQARAGFYPRAITEDVSDARLRRYFNVIDGKYRIAKSVRDLCVFARQDVTKDPPFSKLDLIVCRNVLIYLGAEAQKRIISLFHFALNPNGFLMLGSAETTGYQNDLFSVVDKKYRIYKRKQTTSPIFPFPIDYSRTPNHEHVNRLIHPGVTSLHEEVSAVLLKRYAPPAVLVDRDMQVIQFRGQTGYYLEHASGAADLNLMTMAREGLVHALRTAFHEAARKGKPVRRERLRVTFNGQGRDVTLEVVPLGAEAHDHFLVLFEDVTPPAAQKAGRGAKAEPRSPRRADMIDQHQEEIERLENELAASRDHLQSIIQDLGATNEELQSANEEILSSNEELQSTNEELDTAKEALQSTNEELNTVNEELHSRNEELSRANSDLTNLLADVHIAIVMVDLDMKIRRYTPMAEEVLNLIPGDIARPIGQIKPNIDCPDLETMITHVLDHFTTIERDVRDAHGRWFSLRIRPYRSLDNRIDGAVLALYDIDESRRHEQEARQAQAFAEGIIETMDNPLLVLDSGLRVRMVNSAYCRLFRVSAGEVSSKLLYDLGNGQWDIPDLRSRLQAILDSGGPLERFEVEHDFPSIGRRRMLLCARRLEGDEARPPLILVEIDQGSNGGRDT